MAENAGNATDKASWLRLAASWLGMIKNNSTRIFAKDSQHPEEERQETGNQGWPGPSREDSKASH